MVYLPLWVAVVYGVFQIVNSILTWKLNNHIVETKIKMTELEVNTNNKMDKLLETTANAEFAKGVKSEQDKKDV